MTRLDVQAAWERIVATGWSNYSNLNHDEKVWFNLEPLILGGIIDHYINYGAERNLDTIEALEFLGFGDIAYLLGRVNTLFENGHPPFEIVERNIQWDSWCEQHHSFLNNIENKFWARSKELEKALWSHIEKTKIGL